MSGLLPRRDGMTAARTVSAHGPHTILRGTWAASNSASPVGRRPFQAGYKEGTNDR